MRVTGVWGTVPLPVPRSLVGGAGHCWDPAWKLGIQADDWLGGVLRPGKGKYALSLETSREILLLLCHLHDYGKTNLRQESKKESLFVTNPCQCHWALHLVSPLPTSWGVQFKLLEDFPFPIALLWAEWPWAGCWGQTCICRPHLSPPACAALSASQVGAHCVCVQGPAGALLQLCSQLQLCWGQICSCQAQGPPCPPGQVAAAAILLNCCWGKWQPPKWWVSLGHLFLLWGPWDLLVYSKNR